MKFTKPEPITNKNDPNLNNQARNFLLTRYKTHPTANLSSQILRYCPEERWRISILEIDENFCMAEDGCTKNEEKTICECQKRSFKNVGRVIGKCGKNLKEIERKSGILIFFNKLKKCFVLRRHSHNQKNMKTDHGDLFQAVALILDGLKNERTELSDWEKYYYWWYFHNIYSKQRL
ncbi:splicing branch point binding protein [Pseudoloma neurophilia]|uniref:Splicing branch point binding protein n=1 Tax=Pseudoloma neurophilia TaxID=146866 RepID=A0A0R0LV38_9MICR|nr:splicing branch point binding protein [Pseudoloma neurophilia]